MRFLKLFGKKENEPEAVADQETANCSHLILVPLWDNLADMGNEEKASAYRCYACEARLALEEAAQVRRRNAISLS